MRIDKNYFRKVLLAIIALTCCCHVNAQTSFSKFLTPADSLNKGRLLLTSGSWGLVSGGLLVGLNTAWYTQYERVGFHTFNDWEEWNQMDKAGHTWTAYTETRWVAQTFKWSGVKPKIADAVAAGTSLVFQTTLEMMDGYSAKWGFSWSDVGANVAGAGIFYAQSRLWNEQRISIKFSAQPPNYKEELQSNYTPEVLKRLGDLYGESYVEQTLKDYNGQTYWLSVNPSSFSKNDFSPKWLSIAVGYGAERMLGGRENIWSADSTTYNYSNVARVRQFYISPDVDFTRIPTHSHLLKTVFEIINIIKVPAPAIMLDDKGSIKFYAIYF